MTPSAPRLLRAAQVRRAHGVRGEVRAEPLGGGAERFVPGLRLVREDGGQAYTVRAARPASEGDVLLALEEVRDRDAADGLRGAYLCVDAAQARRLGDDEWFVYQLVGLRAESPAGEPLGEVSDVEDYEQHQVLVLSTPDGERRIPMARSFVERVDVAGGVIVVTPWPEEAG